MRDAGVAAVDVRRDVMGRYNDELTDALEGTVWHHGCQSYFKNANGQDRDAAAADLTVVCRAARSNSRWRSTSAYEGCGVLRDGGA